MRPCLDKNYFNVKDIPIIKKTRLYKKCFIVDHKYKTAFIYCFFDDLSIAHSQWLINYKKSCSGRFRSVYLLYLPLCEG